MTDLTDYHQRWRIEIALDGTLSFIIQDPETGKETERHELTAEQVVGALRRIAKEATND